jgi:hypothetical protein
MTSTTFAELQQRLPQLWPTISPRSTDARRTAVIVHSVNFEIPPSVWPVIPAYEERFLFILLTLLRQPTGRIVYITSQPVLPRLVDYYLSMVPTIDPAEARRRVDFVSVSDASHRPLTDKIVTRPLLVQRIRDLIPDLERALIIPFSTTDREVRLAEALGIPIYGPHPSLAVHGTKSGSRRLFREAGVPFPDGEEDIATRADLVQAICSLQKRRPGLTEVVVKLDDSISGAGNALVDVAGAQTAADVSASLDRLEAVDSSFTPAEYLAALADRGGIVEERLAGNDFASPSVQLRVSPAGEVEVLSTHDQVLGGPAGHEYLGCRFPADARYGPIISTYAERVADVLAQRGMLGRFGIDFVVARVADEWRAWAIEINLRNGGTTHPMLTLIALTEGDFDPALGAFVVPDGTRRHYVASDHIEHPGYAALTPDDVLDLTHREGLCWDADSQTGVALHLVSAVAVAGRLGATAIGTTPAEAEACLARARRALDEAAGIVQPDQSGH